MPSRAPGLLPDPEEWTQAFESKIEPFPTVERVGGADIFIGGAADNHKKFGFGVMRDYADRYRAETNRPTAYFASGKTDQVLEAVRKANQNGGPVNIVGHSLGATDGYNVAAAAKREGLRVDNLITLDPVGGVLWPYRTDSRGVAPERWINVTAQATKPDQSDRMAQLGGKPSQLPIESADLHEQVTAHHADVEALMSRDARMALDGSRSPLLEGELRDDLSVFDWMRLRTTAAERRR